MFKGTNASAGIGIGKAAIIKEVEMVIRPDKVASVETEVQRFRGALADTVAQTKALEETLAREGSGDYAGTPDAAGGSHADR